jgi:hypothetical protein
MSIKILAYTLLFFLLSPGFLLTLYPGSRGFFLSGQTNYYSIILHTLILALLIVSFDPIKKTKENTTNNTKNNTIINDREIIQMVALLLFFALSPGLLVTLPPKFDGIFFSKETSIPSVLTHTGIYLVLLYILTNVIKNNKNFFTL